MNLWGFAVLGVALAMPVNAAPPSYEPAEPVKRATPDYPMAHLQIGRQGWVQVSYCVDETGRPRNMSVVDSTGYESFERSALDAVVNWQFKPATVDGKPVWDSRNQSVITFEISKSNIGANRPLSRRYRKMGELIEQARLDEAREYFRETLADYARSLYEISNLWAQRSPCEPTRKGNPLKPIKTTSSWMQI